MIVIMELNHLVDRHTGHDIIDDGTGIATQITDIAPAAPFTITSGFVVIQHHLEKFSSTGARVHYLGNNRKHLRRGHLRANFAGLLDFALRLLFFLGCIVFDKLPKNGRIIVGVAGGVQHVKHRVQYLVPYYRAAEAASWSFGVVACGRSLRYVLEVRCSHVERYGYANLMFVLFQTIKLVAF